MRCDGRYLICSAEGQFLVSATRNDVGLYDVRGGDGYDFGHYDTLQICELVTRGTWLIQEERQMKAKIEENSVTIICPACRDIDISRGYTHQCDGGVAGVHTVPFQGAGAWGFNGNVGSPTLTPSLLLTYTFGDGREKFVCHSFVKDGRIQFLSDCTHALAGQTVDLPDWEDAPRV